MGDQMLGTELTDEQLVARVCARDSSALSVLYDRYAEPVYGMAAHLLSYQEAEDVVQESFLKLWLHAHQFDTDRGSFAPWLFAIARHEVIAQMRRLTRDRRIAKAGDVESLLGTVADSRVDIEESVWLRDSADEMKAALTRLPEKQRRVLMLAYFGGFTQSEIAEITEAPLGTVKKRVRLGLQALRKVLEAGESPPPARNAPNPNGQPVSPVRSSAEVFDDERH